MLKTIYTTLNGSLLSDISDSSALIPIDGVSLTTLQGEVNFSGGGWTYLLLSSDNYSEEIKVTGISGSNLIAVRATSGSIAKPFLATNTNINPSFRSDAIKDIIATNPPVTDTNVTASGIADATSSGTTFNIAVPAPNFRTEGMAITGSWPNLTFAVNGGDGCGCCGGGGSGGGGGTGVNQLSIASSILQGQVLGSILKLSLNTPIFTGQNGVTIHGDWPNYTIEYTGTGTNGTVTSIGVGQGLSLTGNATTTPVISLKNTGINSGAYGDISVNSMGQITNIAPGFNPISDIVFNGTGGNVSRVDSTVTIDLDDASTGVPGVVELTDSSTDLDDTDDTTATTPKVVDKAIANLIKLIGSGTISAEADSEYTNALTGTATTLEIESGKQALILAEATVVDSTAPTTPIEWGLGIFDNNSNKLYGAKKIAQIKQTAVLVIQGPQISVPITLATTDLGTNGSVISKQLRVLTLNA